MIKVESIDYSIVLLDFPRLVLNCYCSNDSIEEVKQYYHDKFRLKPKDEYDLIGKGINFHFFEDIETIQEMINHIESKDFNYFYEFKSDMRSTKAVIESLRDFDFSNSIIRSKNEESLDKDGEV